MDAKPGNANRAIFGKRSKDLARRANVRELYRAPDPTRPFLANDQLERATSAPPYVDLAKRTGWLCFHVYDSRKSMGVGFPDLTLARGKRVVFIELKTEKGRLRPEQVKWGDTLRDSVAEYYLFRPSDWNTVREVLNPRQQEPLQVPS